MPRRPLVLRVPPLLVLGLLFAVSMAPPTRAQEPSPASSAVRSDHVYTYARPGHATQTVYVWGAVSQPGIWKIEPGTDLVEFLSIVRPSGYGVETPGTRQDVVLRVHRSSGGEARVVHEMRLDELLDRPPSRRPSLQPEDVLEVRTVEQRKFSFQTLTSVLGTVSSLVLLGLRIFQR